MKKFVVSAPLAGGLLNFALPNYAQAAGWGLSLAPHTDWRGHWDNAEYKESDVGDNNRGWLSVHRLNGSSSSPVARIINGHNEIRSGRATVSTGDWKYFLAPGWYYSEMQVGYLYAPELCNTSDYVWSSGNWDPYN